MAHLIVQQDGKTSYVELKQPVTTIGRHATCNIQIQDTKASRTHCQVEECDRGYKLVDLESANGTQVNGERITHKILEAGDLIEIGSAMMTYEVERKDILRVRHIRSKIRKGKRRPKLSRASRDPSASGVMEKATSTVADANDASSTQVVAPPPVNMPPGDGLVPTDFNPQDRAELAVLIRRIMNALMTVHGDAGVQEVEKLFEEFMSEGAVEPRVRHLIEDRDMMASVLEINQDINSELHLEALLDKILDETIEFTDAERGFLILLDDDKAPTVHRARNFDREPIANPDEKFSRAIVREVIEHGRPLLSTNAHEEERFSGSDSVAQQRLLSVLCVPLRVKERLIGALYIDNRFETGVFSERDLLWLDAIADQAAIAIEHARQARALQDALAELKARNAQVQELNALLQKKLQARELELADMKFKLVAKGTKDAPNDRGGYITKHRYDDIVGHSAAMRAVFEVLDKATDVDSMPVMILGENGTGKELIAKALHANGPRAARPFIAENCAAVPKELFEDRFFGHEKGSFTTAIAAASGLFEQADTGTLFLDEVGELTADVQSKLLRVLENGEMRRIGGKLTKKVNVRIIAATNQDLEKLTTEGKFRQDLFYRLKGFCIRLPSLRERLEDMPELVDVFFNQAFETNKIAPKPVDPEVYRLLAAYNWPGNVRQLRNTASMIVALSRDHASITTDLIPEEVRRAVAPKASAEVEWLRDLPPNMPMKEAVRIVTERLEKELIMRVWRECNWKKTETAERLGISRPTLDAKIEAYGLKSQKE